MTISAHDATRTRDCRIPLCDREATRNVGGRGPYADLCDDHHRAQRGRFSAMGRGLADPGLNGNGEVAAESVPRERPERSTRTPGGTLKEAAQALVQPASAVDQAARRKEAADGEYERVRAALADAVRAFQAALTAHG